MAQTILQSESAVLHGTASDDGLPSSTVTTTWSLVSGPGTVIFADATAVDTSATFSATGSYLLRLTADDGELTASDEVEITVTDVVGAVNKSVSDTTVAIGEHLTYTLTVSNPFETTVTGVVLTDSVPANTVLESDSLSADASYSGLDAGSTITWTTNMDLAQGQSLQRTFRVVATAGALVTNTAYLSTGVNSGLLPSNSVETMVLSSASCGYLEGFESGVFTSYWQTHATNDGRVRILADLPHTGTYSAIMDTSSDGVYSEFGLILTLNLAGAGTVDLDFSWQDLGDEYDSDFDGVFIRQNSNSSWHKVYDFSGSNNSSYQAGHVDLVAAALNNGLLLSRSFQVKFQGYDNGFFRPDDIAGGDGYALDDVQLLCSCPAAPAAPVVSVASNERETLLSWSDANDVANYEVWRSSTPYFTPGDPNTMLLQGLPHAGYADDNAIGDGNNYYYFVRAANACGDLSPDSNGTGKFEFAVEPGTG